MIEKLPDHLLIRTANHKNSFTSTIMRCDAELERRYEAIKEDLEAYEEYQNV